MDGNGWEWMGMDGNGWEWMGMDGNVVTMNSHYGSFPHSLLSTSIWSFPRWQNPQLIHFHRIFHSKPPIWGYPNRKPPGEDPNPWLGTLGRSMASEPNLHMTLTDGRGARGLCARCGRNSPGFLGKGWKDGGNHGQIMWMWVKMEDLGNHRC